MSAPIDLEDLAGASGPLPANFNAEEAPNDEAIEMQFAVAAVEQSEVYWNLITKVQPSKLPRLTQWDSEINAAFEKAFPEYLDDAKLAKLSEEEIKSPVGKKRWREFMMPFEKVVADYNFGTLVRLDCEGEYDERNTMFGYRTQFYAIEIARNRRGLNDKIWAAYQKQ